MDDFRVFPVVASRRGDSSILRTGRRTLAMWNLGDSVHYLRVELSRAIARHQRDPSDTQATTSLGFRSPGSVRRALVARQASVLLDLRAVDEGSLIEVRNAVASSRAHLHRGGRWHTVTRGAGKGAATNVLRRLLASDAPGALAVVGIGNEENDATLLESADAGFAIRNPGDGVHPALAAVRGVSPLTSEGTSGSSRCSSDSRTCRCSKRLRLGVDQAG
ncbi:MAG: hypothetical protein V4617_18930 [Gemmatimonadota bacterium]